MHTLETAICEAMGASDSRGRLDKHWKSRAFVMPPRNEDTYLMNLFADEGNAFYGDLTLYTSGFMQALLKQEEDAPMLSVEQRPPPKDSEYIHSMMHWMAIGNHLLAIQSRSLTAKSLESYLTWLVKDKTGVVESSAQVILNAKFDKDEMGGDLDDISEIIVGGTGAIEAGATHDSFSVDGAEGLQTVEAFSDVGSKKTWGERAVAVLRAIMSNEADVQELLESIPSEADLDVSVRIGYKSRKKKISRAPMQQALRNLPEGEVVAKGRFGKSTGKDIRLSYPVRVLMQGSLLDPQDARAKLRSAYNYFVENGKIDED